MSAIDDLRVAMDTWLSTECETAAVSLDAAARMFSAAEAVLAEVDAGHLVDVRPLMELVGPSGWWVMDWGISSAPARLAWYGPRGLSSGCDGTTVAEAIRLAVEARGGDA